MSTIGSHLDFVDFANGCALFMSILANWNAAKIMSTKASPTTYLLDRTKTLVMISAILAKLIIAA
jgi:hypothetical protein